ncbi:hypothetical protein bvRMA01_000925 (plasmid) [Borrelia venezuelensis]|nr:hypothetical protein bvRMA01_000925 [Borrelia venezuelensis]
MGMHKFIALDLWRRYHHDELTYKNLEKLEKNFNIKFDYLDDKIDASRESLNGNIKETKILLDGYLILLLLLLLL